jgi:glycosyltransferase involved in cell wall biosynthesis
VRILHFNEHFGNVGGAERYLAEICAAQAARGWDPVVVASAAVTGNGRIGRVRVYSLEPSFGLRSMRRAVAPLKCIMDAERPDVVHLHNIQYFLGPSLLRQLQARAPVIQTVHDTRVICPRLLSKIIPSAMAPCEYPMGTHCFRHGCYPFHGTPASVVQNLQKFLLVGWELALLRRLDRVLVPSAYMHEQLRLNGVPLLRLEKMPLFLHAGFAPPDRPATTRRIVFAGRIEEAKGIRQFLDCLARLSTLSWTAQVAGSGSFLAEAKAIAVRQGLTERVEFMGQLPVDALAQVLGAARVVVMPSLMPESFGLTGLEALACGTPVVAFDSGGVTEWLADGVTGFVVKWGDVSALAARVRQLLEDDLLAERLGRQSRQHAQRFDRERHVNRLCEIYTEVAAARGAP